MRDNLNVFASRWVREFANSRERARKVGIHQRILASYSNDRTIHAHAVGCEPDEDVTYGVKCVEACPVQAQLTFGCSGVEAVEAQLRNAPETPADAMARTDANDELAAALAAGHDAVSPEIEYVRPVGEGGFAPWYYFRPMFFACSKGYPMRGAWHVGGRWCANCQE